MKIRYPQNYRTNHVRLLDTLAFTRRQIAWAKRGLALTPLHNAPEPGRLEFEREAYGIVLAKLRALPAVRLP